jgi:hypothetical protein
VKLKIRVVRYTTIGKNGYIICLSRFFTIVDLKNNCPSTLISIGKKVK